MAELRFWITREPYPAKAATVAAAVAVRAVVAHSPQSRGEGLVILDDGTTAANAETLRDRAAQALVANRTFLAIGAPSNAQVVAQVQRLTRECSALIRLALGAVDDVSDT